MTKLMTQVPFAEKNQLDGQLQLDHSTQQLCCTDHSYTTLPGQPRVRLDQVVEFGDYLEKELSCPELDQLTPRLWLVFLHPFSIKTMVVVWRLTDVE